MTSTARFGSPDARFGTGTFGDMGGGATPTLHDLVNQGHTSAVVVEVWSPTVLLGYLINPLPKASGGVTGKVLDGQVQVDSTAEFRRRFELTVVDPDGTLTADTADAWLSSYGHEVRIYRGGFHADGTIEAARLGVFGIASVDIDDDGTAVTVKVDGYDRAATIAERTWTQPFPIAAGTNVADAIAMGLLSRWPGLGLADMAVPTATTPALVWGVDDSSDPWKDFSALASSAGLDLYFDGAGTPLLAAVPTVAGRAVAARWVEGEGTSLLAAGRTNSREGRENHVVAVSEGSGVLPLRAEAMDLDPRSRTYVNGGYGDVPVKVSTSLATTQEQLQAFADAELARRRGATDQARITALVDPERDAGDVAQVKRGRANVNDLYLLDQLTIPLTVTSPMACVGRRQ